jgi:c-di-GMP-binding flagellar brake protein YcgR
LASCLAASYATLPEGRAQEALTKNLSAGGLCLVTETPPAPTAQMQVAVRLPGEAQPINAIAEPRWSRERAVTGKTGSSRSVETGLAFVEIAPQDQQTIARFVTRSLQIIG